MISGFENLNNHQFKIAKDAIGWITVLIAGADGNIDKKETAWAEKLTKIRGYSNPNELTPFYEEVGQTFGDDLSKLLDMVPTDTEKRQTLLTRQLGQLNDVLPLLDNAIGASLYESYISFAKHVAKASGGFLGFFSVNAEEASLAELPMIHPIERIDAEEEE